MKRILKIAVVLTLFSACHNQDWDYPDFDYSTVYFPYQAPARTIVLGKDYAYDNTLDNQHKCLIMATMGGVYKNEKNIVINVEVDTSLSNNLRLVNNITNITYDVTTMPSNYYTLPEDMQITIPSGKFSGGIEVQLTDAFFADTNSLKVHYVIPLVITSVAGADSVLRGKTEIDTADRRVSTEWSIVPKDYILYVIKYKNPWDAYYLRRGIDVVTGNGGNTALDFTDIYHEKYVEKDQVCSAVSYSNNQATVSLNALNKDKSISAFKMILTFDNNNKCSITNPATAAYTITGSGEYVKEGDIWGGIQRDVLHLQYSVDFGAATHSFTDTLVLRDRAETIETFNPVVTY